jgi:hypothetical protein
MKIKEIRKLFFIYFIAHGLSLGFIDAHFYDDKFFFTWDKNVLVSTLKQINDLFDYRLYIFLYLRPLGAAGASFISFFLFFFSALAFNRVLNLFYPIRKETAYLLTILYLILPFGLIKFSLSIIPYLFCMFFFLLGWYFMIRSRVLSLFLFFISFNMQSLLVLYSLPILSYYFYEKKNKPLCTKEFLIFLIKRIEYTILPFLFFYIKFTFFKGVGPYQGYNEIYNIQYLFVNPVLQFLDLFRNNLSIGFLIFSYFLVFLILKYYYIYFDIPKKKNQTNINFLIVVIGVAGSLFPYWIVGHIPTFSSYSSRHQLLLLISMPFFIVYLLNFCNKKYHKLSVILILILSFSLNFKIYSDYYIDYFKQKKLIEYIVENKILFANNNIIIMNDKIRNSTVTYANNNNQIYSNANFKRALKNEKNFVININELDDYNSGKFDNQFSGYFLASQHKRINNNDIIILTIESEGFLKFVFTHKKVIINQ